MFRKIRRQKIGPIGRLVARGCKEDSIKTFEKESPTASKDTLTTLLSTINTINWNLKSMDIKTAFLQGENLIIDVYIKPPTEVHCNMDQIWKSNKCVFGLIDPSLMWYKWVKKFVYENGDKSSIVDPVLLVWHHNKLIGITNVHVDGFLCAVTELIYQTFIYKLRETFSVGRHKNCNFKYLCRNVKSSKHQIIVCQFDFIEQLKKIQIGTINNFWKEQT